MAKILSFNDVEVGMYVISQFHRLYGKVIEKLSTHLVLMSYDIDGGGYSVRFFRKEDVQYLKICAKLPTITLEGENLSYNENRNRIEVSYDYLDDLVEKQSEQLSVRPKKHTNE